MRIDRRVAVPALAALAVTALGVSVAVVADRPGDGPPRLPLAATRAAQADAALGGATSDTGYELVGTLPGGRPDDARVWLLPGGPADADVVRALARALEAGAPAREGDAWRAGGLLVQDGSGQPWSWSACLDGAVSSDGEVRCAIAVPGSGGSGSSGSSGGAATGSGGGTDGSAPDTGVTSPAPPPRPGDDPSPAPEPVPEPTGTPLPVGTVQDAARPVLAALGLTLDDAEVTTTPYGGSLVVPRRVDGLDAHGYGTRIEVGADGALSYATGWLGAPRPGEAYPLITAQQAFDQLPPRMVALLCPVGPDGKGCQAPPPAQVTGATLGLTLQPLRGGSQLLVPAWLFALKGMTDPVSVVAVQPQYLDTGSDEPSTEPRPTGSDQPVPVEPSTGTGSGGPGQTEPGVARAPFSFDAAWPGDTSTTLVVRYGDSSSCVHENVTHAVKESEDTVVVLLEADARDPDLACTEDYRPVERLVRLQAPLGDRVVVDGASGRPVPLSAAR